MRVACPETRVGLVTIGQAPRDDVVPEMMRWLDPAKVLERGALDGVSLEEASRFAPGPEDQALVTRFRDGSSVTVGKANIVSRVQQAVTELEERGASAIVVMCTGEFPALEHRQPLLTADRLFVNGTRAIASGRRAGILCPLPEQEEFTYEKWKGLGEQLHVAAGSPYGASPESLQAPARLLRETGAEYIVLDCMGYTQAMKEVVSRSSGVPAILARSVVARLTAEVLG